MKFLTNFPGDCEAFSETSHALIRIESICISTFLIIEVCWNPLLPPLFPLTFNQSPFPLSLWALLSKHIQNVKRIRSKNIFYIRTWKQYNIREIPSYHLSKRSTHSFERVSIKQQTIFIKCVVKRFFALTWRIKEKILSQ